MDINPKIACNTSYIKTPMNQNFQEITEAAKEMKLERVSVYILQCSGAFLYFSRCVPSKLSDIDRHVENRRGESYVAISPQKKGIPHFGTTVLFSLTRVYFIHVSSINVSLSE